MSNTIVNIPGRESQTLTGMVLSEKEVRDAYAGVIDLGSYVATTTKSGDDTIITFANRTGTKGADTIVNIPGRESQTLTGMVLSEKDVRDAYAGVIDLGSYVATTTTSGGNTVITFANRTGTKGADTIVNIPGRESQTLTGMVLSEKDVRDAYAGVIDLGSYVATTTTSGGNTVITFANRTGTKGATAVIIDGVQVLSTPVDMDEEDVLDILESGAFGDVTDYEYTTQEVGNTTFMTFTPVMGELEALLNKNKPVDLKALLLQGLVDSDSSDLEEDEGEDYYCFDEFDEFDEGEEDEDEVTSTEVIIDGMTPRVLQGIIMDASMLIAAYRDTIDLSQYVAEERVQGSVLKVYFTKRQGAKGALA
jgi:L-amino acid N-acyltransferase YncA